MPLRHNPRLGCTTRVLQKIEEVLTQEVHDHFSLTAPKGGSETFLQFVGKVGLPPSPAMLSRSTSAGARAGNSQWARLAMISFGAAGMTSRCAAPVCLLFRLQQGREPKGPNVYQALNFAFDDDMLAFKKLIKGAVKRLKSELALRVCCFSEPRPAPLAGTVHLELDAGSPLPTQTRLGGNRRASNIRAAEMVGRTRSGRTSRPHSLQ